MSNDFIYMRVLTRLLENNTFSVLHYIIKVTLAHLTLHRFEIHSTLELSCTALCCHLTKTRGCLLAINYLTYIIFTNSCCIVSFICWLLVYVLVYWIFLCKK